MGIFGLKHIMGVIVKIREVEERDAEKVVDLLLRSQRKQLDDEGKV
jgi:hypothetical protein